MKRTYMSIGSKDAKTQEIAEGFLEEWSLLVCPKVGLEDMLEHSRVLELDDSSELGDTEGPCVPEFFVKTLVLLRDLVTRGAYHEDHVADEGVAPRTLEVRAGFDTICGIAVLDNDSQDVDDESSGEVLPCQLLKELFECWRCGRRACDCSYHCFHC